MELLMYEVVGVTMNGNLGAWFDTHILIQKITATY